MHTERLLMMLLVGLAAQLVDGTIGMGYGVTSATLLLSVGLAPPLVSASVHTAELFVSAVSGASHLKLGNVRRDLTPPLAIAGVAGGILGSVGLVQLPVRPVRLVVGFALAAMGAVIVYRFGSRDGHDFGVENGRRYRRRHLAGLGFLAGAVDALAGGGWGPICTPSLVITGTRPSEAVGSVNLAEFFVTLATSLTLIALIGISRFQWDIVGALIVAGVVAAPVAAWLCRKLPHRVLGIAVGCVVLALSVRMIVRAWAG
jgi:uncharacterized membrane protein YfcA